MTQTTELSGFVAFYIGNDRNLYASTDPVQLSGGIYKTMDAAKESHSLATGYIDLSRIPQDILEFRK